MQQLEYMLRKNWTRSLFYFQIVYMVPISKLGMQFGNWQSAQRNFEIA